MKRIAWYITGHGFGHATRSLASIRALVEREASISVEIESALPAFIFRELAGLGAAVSVRPVKVDVGFLQKDGLVIDHPATVRALSGVLDDFSDRVELEAAHLRKSGASLVVADVPAAPILAARRAGIPSAVVANFDWSFIYDAYREVDPVYRRASEVFAGAYAQADLLLRLPFSPAMSLFPTRKDVPLVVRRRTASREEVRSALGIAADPRPMVLISFGGLGLGGFGLEGFSERSVAGLDDILFVAFGERSAETPPHVLRIRDDAFHFPDLVHAADAVITKLGYGIVSEAVASRTGIIYTPRPDFPEYAVMTAELGKYVPAREVAVADLQSGAFADLLRGILPKSSAEPRGASQEGGPGPARMYGGRQDVGREPRGASQEGGPGPARMYGGRQDVGREPPCRIDGATVVATELSALL